MKQGFFGMLAGFFYLIGQFFVGVYRLINTNWLTLLVFEVVYKLIAYFACRPLLKGLFYLAFKASGYKFASNFNIGAILVNPFSWIFIFCALFLVSFYILFDICCIVICFHASYHRQKIPLLFMVKKGIIAAKDILWPKNYRMILYLLLIIPLSQIISITGFVDGFAIPDFVMQFIEKRNWLYIIFIVASVYVEIVCMQWIFSFHNFTLRHEKFVDASHRSWNMIKGKKTLPAFILSIVGWEIMLVAIFYGLTALCGFVIVLIEQIPSPGITTVLDSGFAVVLDIFYGLAFCFSVPLVFLGISQIYYMGMERLGMKDEIPERFDTRGAIRLVDTKISKLLYRKKSVLIVIGIIAVLAVNLIFAFYRESGYYKGLWFTDIKITAHRGEAEECPENTMPAFEKAVEEGADMIELDVHLSSDGIPVVMHDESLKRTTGLNKDIGEMKAADIHRLDCGSWFSKEYANTRVPLLAEVIRFAIDSDIMLNIELKPSDYKDGLAETVIDMVKAYHFENNCLLSSLDYPELEDAKAYDPSIPTMYITHISYGDMTQLDAADGFAIETSSVYTSLIKKLQRRGKFVYVWTVNSSDELEEVIEMKPDGIVTDATVTAIGIVKEKDKAGYWNDYIETLKKMF